MTTQPKEPAVSHVTLPVDLRDYFAAKVLQGVISNHAWQMGFDEDVAAAYAYRFADAMLAARGEQ